MSEARHSMSRRDVDAAAARLNGRIVRTPVLRSAELDRLAGTRLWFKAENLQRGGSYKLRGALNAVQRVADAGGAGGAGGARGGSRGVIAQSTGNHAIAIGMAAREYGLTATLVVASTAAPSKVALAKATGARVILGGLTFDSCREIVRDLEASSEDVVIDAYDHPDVIAGQGTASLELIEDLTNQGEPLDALVVPVGGGGGIAGACLAAGDIPADIFGVEPDGCDGLAQSLAAGHRVTITPSTSLADGLMPACPGQLPFDIASGRLSGVLTVDDPRLRRAVVLAIEHLKLVLEPSGAAGLAAALDGAFAGFRNTGIILTGGNVDSALIARLITEHADDRVEGVAAGSTQW
jgi:threonine dehydratase